jgi:hypothetical protein
MNTGTRVTPELAATAGEWEYICCYCMVELHTGSGVHTSGPECAACGNQNLRFIHVLQNDKDHRQIMVGLDCAGFLTEDYDTPGLAENETKRKEHWRIYYRTPGRCVTTVHDLIEKGKL